MTEKSKKPTKVEKLGKEQKFEKEFEAVRAGFCRKTLEIFAEGTAKGWAQLPVKSESDGK